MIIDRCQLHTIAGIVCRSLIYSQCQSCIILQKKSQITLFLVFFCHYVSTRSLLGELLLNAVDFNKQLMC